MRKSLKVTRRQEGSTFVQYIRMNAINDRIECVNEVEWQTYERMLKVNFPFPTTLRNANSTYDISLGTISRGIPNFAPELFKRVRLQDPLKQKQLLKGLIQLSEEGAVQVFRPLMNNDLIVGVVGTLQFDVVISRLQHEYHVDASYEDVSVSTARWVDCDDKEKLEDFRNKCMMNLALDGGDNLTYIAPTKVNLNLTEERWPDIKFFKTREH